jgi:hypothetical protein
MESMNSNCFVHNHGDKVKLGSNQTSFLPIVFFSIIKLAYQLMNWGYNKFFILSPQICSKWNEVLFWLIRIIGSKKLNFLAIVMQSISNLSYYLP